MQCAQLVNRVATNTLLLIETMFPVKYWLHSGEFLASKRDIAIFIDLPNLNILLCKKNLARILDGAFNSLQELNASENSITRLLLVGTGATLVSLNVYHAKISSLGQEFFDALQLTYLRNLLMKDNQLTRLPQSNGKLQRLHTLDLANNNLASLPKTI
ncbi:hypothetical protein BY996DRAFT_6416871 [Phakopsora pachyrhizi]|nr:hypothetical protein BY996DRAFT_6416871 [Phakopsora pachyrhizi]